MKLDVKATAAYLKNLYDSKGKIQVTYKELELAGESHGKVINPFLKKVIKEWTITAPELTILHSENLPFIFVGTGLEVVKVKELEAIRASQDNSNSRH